MRAGIDNHIVMIVVREVDIFRIAAEGELHDPHAGKTKIVTQLFDIRCNYAEVFGNDWEIAQRFPNRHEQLAPRRFNPPAALGGFIFTGYFPARCKTAKVIDAREIYNLQRRAHALDPPSKSV